LLIYLVRVTEKLHQSGCTLATTQQSLDFISTSEPNVDIVRRQIYKAGYFRNGTGTVGKRGLQPFSHTFRHELGHRFERA
jgi:hypothetical protein